MGKEPDMGPRDGVDIVLKREFDTTKHSLTKLRITFQENSRVASPFGGHCEAAGTASRHLALMDTVYPPES
jgi:hypothetical protein